MKITSLVALSLAATMLAGCSSGKPAGDGRACVDVGASTLETIAEGANTSPIVPVAGAAVKSKKFKDAYIVAMTFEDPSGETSTGAWALTGSVDQPTSIMAVDGYATSFTDWPNEVGGEQLNVAEDGVTEAKSCLAALGD